MELTSTSATEVPRPGPRARGWTVRHLMLAVVVVAGLLWGYRVWPSVVNLFNDDPHHAFQQFKRTWALGPTPRVTVDLFEGSIHVLPSLDDQVSAAITAHAKTKDLQAVADAALASIRLDLHHVGDLLRITARGASEIRMDGIEKDVWVVLHVPKAVTLDLRTGRGAIVVGHDYTGFGLTRTLVHQPITATSIRARNDSKHRVGFTEGDVFIEANAVRPAGRPPIPTRIQVDAPGQIRVVADLAHLEATAWHGSAPEAGSEGDQNRTDEGSVWFQGGLAPGTHSVRAAHDVALRLTPGPPLEIHAAATEGGIQGNLLPDQIRPTAGQARWDGSTGSAVSATLRVQTDRGSITLDQTSPSGP